jgi:hypothetical protein
MTRPIFLLTDFGTRDHYVGQLRAVLTALAPGSPVHDLTHEVDPFAVTQGAWLLETALPFLPGGAVVVAVVDPEVGTRRRAIAVRDGQGRIFVGPDNGLLSGLVAVELRRRHGERMAPAEPPLEVRLIVTERLVSSAAAISPTFHGRDLFAPAAGRQAAGEQFSSLGELLPSLRVLAPFEARPGEGGSLLGEVVHIDRFGTAITTVRGAQLPAGGAVAVHVGGRSIRARARTFGELEPGEVFHLMDSSGFLALAMNRGSAADELALSRGSPVVVRTE